MPEYTLWALLAAAGTVLLDRFSDVRLLCRRSYYLFLAIIFGMKLLVNGALTAGGIVRYDARFFLGLRLFSIPLEDFLFGFSMITVTLLLWERSKQ